MIIISNLGLIVLVIIPPVFQLIFGSKATNPSYPIDFWRICLISFLGLLLATVLNVSLMTKIIKQSGSKDGLPIAGILFIEAVIGSIMIVIALIQLFIKHRRKINL